MGHGYSRNGGGCFLLSSALLATQQGNILFLPWPPGLGMVSQRSRRVLGTQTGVDPLLPISREVFTPAPAHTAPRPRCRYREKMTRGQGLPTTLGLTSRRPIKIGRLEPDRCLRFCQQAGTLLHTIWCYPRIHGQTVHRRLTSVTFQLTPLLVTLGIWGDQTLDGYTLLFCNLVLLIARQDIIKL